MRILGNAAMSLDGRIALAGGKRARLSGPEDKARVHRLRHEVDAILVGVGTVLKDDPELLVDASLAGVPTPRHPTRVVLDGRLRTPASARVLRGSVPTLLFCAEDAVRPMAGAEVLAGGKARVELSQVVATLQDRGCRSLLVEGGARVHHAFLQEARYDSFTVYLAPRVLGEGPSLTEGPGAASVAEAPGMRLRNVSVLGEGALLTFERP